MEVPRRFHKVSEVDRCGWRWNLDNFMLTRSQRPRQQFQTTRFKEIVLLSRWRLHVGVPSRMYININIWRYSDQTSLCLPSHDLFTCDMDTLLCDTAHSYLHDSFCRIDARHLVGCGALGCLQLYLEALAIHLQNHHIVSKVQEKVTARHRDNLHVTTYTT